MIEAVGLWMVERWGEYFAVVATSLFLPLKIYELTEKITWLRAGLLLVNIAAVVWLIWSKRLFGNVDLLDLCVPDQPRHESAAAARRITPNIRRRAC